MAEPETEPEYKQAFKRRVADARIARGWKQWQMADALQIPQDQYKQYESRGLLPHRYLWAFCMFARVNIEWLLTGKGRRLAKEIPPVEPDIKPAKAKKARSTKAA